METSHSNPVLFENIETYMNKVRKEDNTLQIQMGDGHNGVVVNKIKGLRGKLHPGVEIACQIGSLPLESFEQLKKSSFGEKAETNLSGKLVALTEFPSSGGLFLIATYVYNDVEVVYNDIVELSCLLFDCTPKEIISGFAHPWR